MLEFKDFSKLVPSDIQTLIETELPPNPCWIEPGILPKRGKLLFGGHAKIGKSFIVLELCRALATGTTPFSCNTFRVIQPVPVLLIEQELGPWRLQDRVRQIFAKESRENPELLRKNFRYLSQVRGFRFDQPDAVNTISGWVQNVGANVLVLDPIGKLHGYDENDSTQIAKLFDKLERIQDNCKKLDLSIVLSHHFGKPNRDPKIEVDKFSPYNFRGSSKWFDDPDTLVTIVRVEKEVAGRDGWYIQSAWTLRGGPPALEEGASFSVFKEGDGKVMYEPGRYGIQPLSERRKKSGLIDDLKGDLSVSPIKLS